MAPLLDVTQLVDSFWNAATVDPLSTLLLLVGAALVAVSSGVFGVLAAGGLLDAIVPDTLGRAPPRED